MPAVRYVLALALSLGHFLSGTAQTLDPAFGTAGQYLLTTADGESLNDMVRMTDGRIVAVGTRTLLDNSELRVVRLLANGTPDPSFGTGGMLSILFGDGYTQGITLVVLNDGRIVAAGGTEVDGARRMFAYRMLVNGDPDPSFGTGGLFLSDVGVGGEHLTCLLLQGDGNVLLGGDVVSATTTSACIIRLTTTGTLDNSWGDGGVMTHNAFGGTEVMLVNDMVLDAAGQVLATGLTAISGTNDAYVMHLLPDAGLDPDYGIAGEALIIDNATDEYGSAIVIAPSGDAYVAGTRFIIGGDDLILHHLATDGTVLDLGGNMSWQLIVDGSEYSERMIMDPYGGLILSVTSYDMNFIGHAQVLRLTTTPAVDASFGINGWITLPAPENAEAGAVLLEPDGTLLFCGFRYPSEGASEGVVAHYDDLPMSIDAARANDSFGVSPNPCNGQFTLRAAQALERVCLRDAAGRQVLDERLTLAAGADHVMVLPSSISPG
ncbi:MAG TPA: delta-60 repeat domain-containing protein, partial [Flavobacteriales bacterium]|nr:delta-60 repeat domain-containing protein [Flavobacteriales bacterium]